MPSTIGFSDFGRIRWEEPTGRIQVSNMAADLLLSLTGYNFAATGTTGPTGSFTPLGTNFGDYVYWNGTAWVVGDANITLGGFAGQTNQGVNAVALGYQAGQFNQQTQSVAIGYQAAYTGQGSASVAIGPLAGSSSQSFSSVAIGTNAGQFNQLAHAVAIGISAGYTGQGDSGIAIGVSAAQNTQGTQSIAIGLGAATFNQNTNSIAIGTTAAQNTQGTNSIAIGFQTARYSQPANSVDIGYQAGMTGQGTSTVAIGYQAGMSGQGIASTAVGYQSGLGNQGAQSVSVGNFSNSIGISSVAVGNFSLATTTASSAITIGDTARSNGIDSVVIGHNAGQNINIGTGSIALGAYAFQNTGPNNSICINASDRALDGATGGLYINPIRTYNDTGAAFTLVYNNTNKEVTASTKTFIIDHPDDNNKYLVHSCLEGPEAAVFYRGQGNINNGKDIISLPSYTKHFSNFTINITPVWNGKMRNLNVTDIENNKYTVYGEDGKYNYIIYAKRHDIIVEPFKNEIEVKGAGPYKYY